MNNEDDNQKLFDIIIIGAGIAGLSSSYYLNKKSNDLNILILEGKDKHGGRLCSFDLKNGDQNINVELGGEWISRHQLFIDWLIDDLKLEYEVSNQSVGKTVWNLHFKKPTIDMQQSKSPQLFVVNEQSLTLTQFPSKSHFNFLSNFAWKMYLIKIKSLFRNLGKKYTLGMKTQIIDSLDGYSMASYFDLFLSRIFLSKKRKAIMDVVHRLLFGSEAKQIPFLFYLAYSLPLMSFHSAGIYEAFLPSRLPTFVDTAIGGPLRVKGGSHTICDKIIERLDRTKTNITYNRRVTHVKQSTDTNEFTVICSDQTSYKCKKIIFAIPPICLRDISFQLNTPLPAGLRTLCQHFQPGRVMKFVIVYPLPFWRSINYSGYVINGSSDEPMKNPSLSYETPVSQNAELDLQYSYFNTPQSQFRFRSNWPVAPFDFIYDSSSECTSNTNDDDNNLAKTGGGDALVKREKCCGTLSGFIAGDHYDFWINKSRDERYCAITAYLNFVWKTTKAKESIHYIEKDWVSEDLCYGGPVGVPSIGFSKYLVLLREPHDKSIYFSGAESADLDVGSISGAVQSGMRSAITCLLDNWPETIDSAELLDVRVIDFQPGSYKKSLNKPGCSNLKNDIKSSNITTKSKFFTEKTPLLIANILICLFSASSTLTFV